MSVLRHGMTNSGQVRALQARLNALLPGADLNVDGDFGNATFEAVKAAQRMALAQHVPGFGPEDVDGVAGPQTLAALAMLEGRNVGGPARQSPAPAAQPQPDGSREFDATITMNDIVPAAQFNEIAEKCGISPAAMRRGLERTIRQINTIHPEMRPALALGMRDMFEEGIPVVLNEGVRSGAAQNAAYRRGASRARAGQSPHNYAMAADIVQMGRDGNAMDWRDGGADYSANVHRMRHHMQSEYGLSVIGTWDPDHYQMGGSNWASIMRSAGGRRDEDGFLQIPEDRIPRKMREATEQLAEIRNPTPPPLPRMEVAEASQAQGGFTAPLQNAARALGSFLTRAF